ncbi:MAG TPA: cytochrome c oxidase subunit I [Candidatus Limnocylindrales bacterium]|nr:cytochrome c oxidase subunit I [Candidatus Limnocylindrales bacterium]
MATTTLHPPIAQPARRSAIYEWVTTTDHKKIGILYFINSFVFFFIGGLLALGVRAELAQPGLQFVNEDLYNQFLTMHASAMLFLFIIPIGAAFGNYVVPLMVGAPDMAFPRINALSFWMLPAAGLLMMSGFIAVGGAAAEGWTSYPPLAGPQFSETGTDLWLMAVTLIGTSSILTAINFLVTIFKMRAPGLTLFRLPIMVWTQIVTSVLTLLATPVLASALIMLFIDRNYGGNYFDPAGGGSVVLWQNVFWFYSHPAVYIMILPFMGIISEVLPVFSRKPLFGYRAFVFATVAIGALGFSVWAHHMFTTGQVFLPFFALFTFLIAVPTGVKMFNWIATLWRGQLVLKTPLLFAIGFLTMFLIGGLNGAFAAAVPVDFAIHDTYYVVAHLHYVLFGGSVFGVMAGIYYWFPKMTGRMLDETVGKIHWLLMFIGFNLAFFPQHQLGLVGMPRRIADYAADAGWGDLNLVSTVGAFLIAASTLPFLWNIFASLRAGEVAGDDPWEGNTLEWATTSPPPPYNFDHLPEIHSTRPVFDLRHGADAGSTH